MYYFSRDQSFHASTSCRLAYCWPVACRTGMAWMELPLLRISDTSTAEGIYKRSPKMNTSSLDRPVHWNAAGMLSILAGIIRFTAGRASGRFCMSLSSAFIQCTISRASSITMHLALFSLPIALLSLNLPTLDLRLSISIARAKRTAPSMEPTLAAQQRLPLGQSPDLHA